ncbi:MAG: UPF0158 family protein, partial [Candidatus Thermoplasmatota archaeon]
KRAKELGPALRGLRAFAYQNGGPTTSTDFERASFARWRPDHTSGARGDHGERRVFWALGRLVIGQAPNARKSHFPQEDFRPMAQPAASIRIDFEEVAWAMTDQSCEWFLDPKTGETIQNADPMFTGVDIEIPDGALRIPMLLPSETWEDRRVFAESLADANARSRLLAALTRRKPFRQFSDALAEFPPIREQWFSWERGRMRERIEEWLVDEGIEFEEE